MIDILIGIGILSVIEAALIFIFTRCLGSESTVVQLIETLSLVLAFAVGLLLIVAVVCVACAFIAHSLPEFAEMLK